MSDQTAWEQERGALLGQKISELGLTIRGSRVERLVEQLYAELGGEGRRVSAAGVSERSVGLPGRDAADRRSVLSRRSAARAHRGGDVGRCRGRRRGDALPAPRVRARRQLRVQAVRACRMAPHALARSRVRIASAIAPIRSRANTSATSSAGTRRSIPTRISPRRSRCG